MLYKSVFILILLSADISAQNWNNPENQMLTNSMNSFFSYQISPGGFSNPGSLADTNRRSSLSDAYHDESEAILEHNISQMQYNQQYSRNNLYRPNKPRYYNSNYKLHYLHPKLLK